MVLSSQMFLLMASSTLMEFSLKSSGGITRIVKGVLGIIELKTFRLKFIPTPKCHEPRISSSFTCIFMKGTARLFS